jgi:hypothetical protein
LKRYMSLPKHNVIAATQNTELGWPTGDQPGDLRFQHAPSPAAQEAILRALSPVFPPAKSPDAALRALTPPDGIAGRYRLDTPDGAWFVRASMWLGDAALEKLMLDYLVSKGVPVNRLLVAGIMLEWDGKVYRIDVRPLIEGRHFDGSPRDLAQAASTLAACHIALSDFPFADPIRRAADKRYRQQVEARHLIDEAILLNDFQVFGAQAVWARDHVSWLREMVSNFKPLFHRLSDAQCIHGQVHPGNVLFQDSIAVLVDWEEAVYNFAPPAFDLAYFVQRFCLHDNPPPDALRQRLDTIAAHYGPLPPLAGMMRQLAWMSMAAIVDFQKQGIATPPSEYDKFVRLEQQARTLVSVL